MRQFDNKALLRLRPLLFCLLLPALAASGCAGTVRDLNAQHGMTDAQKKEVRSKDETPRDAGHSWPVKVLLYPLNRVLDTLDILRLNLGVGPGFGLNLRATKFAQAGVENYFTVRAGLGKRGGLLSPRYGLLYTEAEILTMGAGPLYTGGSQRGAGEVGGSLHLGIIGIDAAVDTVEIADWIGGFFFLDFKGDDW